MFYRRHRASVAYVLATTWLFGSLCLSMACGAGHSTGANEATARGTPLSGEPGRVTAIPTSQEPLVFDDERVVEVLSPRLAQAANAHGRGRPAVTPLRVGGLATGQEQAFDVFLSGERCYLALAVAGLDSQDLDLFLFDAEGAEIARDVTLGSTASLEICTDRSRNYRLVVKMYEGSGAYALRVFAS